MQQCCFCCVLFLLLYSNERAMSIIPQNFEDWKICVEKKCGIPLTLESAKRRLAVYEDERLDETKRFVNLYGHEHLRHIKDWFRRIIREEEIKMRF